MAIIQLLDCGLTLDIEALILDIDFAPMVWLTVKDVTLPGLTIEDLKLPCANASEQANKETNGEHVNIKSEPKRTKKETKQAKDKK